MTWQGLTNRVRCAIICCSLILGGCASTSTLEELNERQDSTEAIMQDQARQIEQQSHRLAFLESERQTLVDALYVLQNSLVQPSSESTAEGLTDEVVDQNAGEPAPVADAVGFEKVNLGRIEWVWFDLFGRSVETHVDPTIKSSSIYAVNPQFFERDGDEWIRFALTLQSADGGPVQAEYFESSVVKKVRVKKPQSDDVVTRAVVSLRMQIGELVDEVQFTVVNAKNRRTGVVLGRSFLRDIAEVDAAKEFVQPKPVK